MLVTHCACKAMSFSHQLTVLLQLPPTPHPATPPPPPHGGGDSAGQNATRAGPEVVTVHLHDPLQLPACMYLLAGCNHAKMAHCPPSPEAEPGACAPRQKELFPDAFKVGATDGLTPLLRNHNDQTACREQADTSSREGEAPSRSGRPLPHRNRMRSSTPSLPNHAAAIHLCQAMRAVAVDSRIVDGWPPQLPPREAAETACASHICAE